MVIYMQQLRHIIYLSSPCFDHKLSCQVRSWLRFQWTYHYAFVKRITGNNLVRKDLECVTINNTKCHFTQN